MASVYPIAVLAFIAMVSTMVLPPLYWLIAFWQRKLGFSNLFKASLILSVLPVFSVLFFFYVEAVSSKYKLILLFTTPLFCMLSLIFVVVATSVNAWRLRSMKSDAKQ